MLQRHQGQFHWVLPGTLGVAFCAPEGLAALPAAQTRVGKVQWRGRGGGGGGGQVRSVEQRMSQLTWIGVAWQYLHLVGGSFAPIAARPSACIPGQHSPRSGLAAAPRHIPR